MSAGRRGLILSGAFVLLVLGLYPTPRAAAQPPQFRPNGFQDPNAGRHTIWQHNLTPDQLRQLFGQYDKGDNGANKQIEDLLRNEVLKKNPNADPKQLDATIKKLLGNKEFMDRVTDLAQKHKNNPNRAPDSKLVPEDFARDFAQLKDRMTQDGRPNPFKVPKFDPDNVPKFDPKSFDPKNFDPEDFPHADPKNPPRIDPDSGLPLNPRTNRPFDPRTGGPLDPRTGEPPDVRPDPLVRPKDNPEVPPKIGEQPPLPKIDPNQGRPFEPKEPEPEFDPENPRAPKDSPEKLAKQKAYDTATALWEKNVGPIEQTPAVKQAIFDLINDREAMDALTDDKGNSFLDMFKDGADGEGLKDLFSGIDGGKWEWPKLDWKLDWGKNSGIDFPNAPKSKWPQSSGSKWPSGGSWGGWGGSFNFGGVAVPWLLVLVLLAVIIAAIVWWKWDAIARAALRGRRAPVYPHGLGPWPIDPNEINSREDVVKAFEYLSVLICGPAAKTWTHSTVADELTALARTHGETALKLARLYELARYAPLDEPLTRSELLEARRLVCDLAGMD